MVTAVDQYTGEVLEEDQLTDFQSMEIALRNDILPVHIQKLREKGLDAEEEEYQYSVLFGTDPVPFNIYLNQTVTVVGVAFYPHPSYKSKVDGSIQEGYFKTHIALEEKDRNGANVVLSCSGINIFDHMRNAVKNYGWFLWDKPVKYLITQGKNNIFYMRRVDRPKPTTVKEEKK